MRPYNIEKPLWIFVGSKVIGSGSSSFTKADQQNVSDVTRVVQFFQYALSQPQKLQINIDKILNSKADLINTEGDDIFEHRFEYLKNHRPNVADILNKVFHGAGQIEAYQIKQAEGEIGLRTKMGEQYFAVINIGDVSKYSKKLEEDSEESLVIEDDHFTKSLFQDISSTTSTVNILIGSKKFIEGWNSWRVSSMGLMNMGKGEGAQIIQLFGRGVRLKGKELSLKREEADAPYYIRALQTISIFGLNASYMNNFLTNIEKETPEYQEYPIPINFNKKEEWEGKIITFKTADNHNFKNFAIKLEVKGTISRRITIDLRPKISVAASGLNNQLVESAENQEHNFLNEFYGFIDFNALLIEANRFKLLRGYTNLIINRNSLEDIIRNDHYKLLSQPGQFGIQEAVTGKIQEVAGYVIKDYLNKFYADKEKDYLTRNLTFDVLTEEKYPDLFPANHKIVIKIPKDQASIIEKLLKDIEKFYQEDVKDIPTIHFDRHLYSPIAAFREGKKYQEIKSFPVKLNEGETKFLKHLKSYFKSAKEKLRGKEIYILRNLSRRGVGFFIESSSFFPDFIIWVVDGKKQSIYFLDPKGIRMLGNFKDDKILFCSNTIQEINISIREKAKKQKKDLDINLDAYILSISKFQEIKNNWGNSDATQEDFRKNHVLFIDDSKNYLNELFGKVLA
ncbi:MAG: hypothetical protein CV087_09025 [Candidatus Brocadia sp. WS118]|nr:MAG: hypothetical protein CV087_09025 [Candidatus Brocadia sp. WS118]